MPGPVERYLLIMDESRPLGGRDGMSRLCRGLIAYGIIGLVVAAIGFGSMVWVNSRISQLRGEAETTLVRLASTTELAATVLREASTTAQSFSGTVDQSSQAVTSAALTVTQVRSELSALEAQLRSVNFLGQTPLGSSADSVARIANSMDGLDTQLPLIAADLGSNRDALARNAVALSDLGNSTAALAARLGPSDGPDSIGEVQQVVAITLLMFAAWSFVPAAAALALGLWLRRELGRSRATPV
jgi:hypothetical protein